MSSPVHHLRGFSIIEIVISIFIIAMMLLLLEAVLHGIPLIKLARDQDIALKIAGNEIEGLRAGGYDALPATGSFSDSLLSSLASSTAQVTVSVYNTTTKQVTATVAWREQGESTDRQMVLSTLITQVGGLT